MTTLDAFRQATLDDARDEAARLVAAAEADAAETLHAAREHARQVRGRARDAGRDAARRHLLREAAEVRRRAREEVLRAHRQVREEVRDRAVAALLAGRDDPSYQQLCTRLAGAVRRQLGPAAHVQEDPDGGGVVGTRDRRRVDYRVSTLVDRVLEDVDPEDLGLDEPGRNDRVAGDVAIASAGPRP